jgi:hypothetical protein
MKRRDLSLSGAHSPLYVKSSCFLRTLEFDLMKQREEKGGEEAIVL